MQDTYKVVFRHYDDEWEAYAVDHGAFGYGATIKEARADFCEALSLLLERSVSPDKFDEYLEECVYPETESYPAIWVRTYQDWDDSERLLARREYRRVIRDHLESNPEDLRTFGNGTSAFGDVIATVCFEDDLLVDLLQQIGDVDRLFVCVPDGDTLLWNCIFTAAADNVSEESVDLKSFNLSALASVGDFMKATGVTPSAAQPKRILVPA